MKYQIPHHAAFKVVQHCRLAAVKADLLQVPSHDQNINEDQIWTDMILTTCTQLVLCCIEERGNNNQFARYALNFLLWV